MTGAAHVGYDIWQQREAETASVEMPQLLPRAGTPLASMDFERVEGRYIHGIVTSDIDGSPAVTSLWRDAISGDVILKTSIPGNRRFAYRLQIRGGQQLSRINTDPWTSSPLDAHGTELLEASLGMFAEVAMYQDVLPAEVLPYLTVNSDVEERMDVEPIGPRAVAEQQPEAGDLSTSGNVDPLLQDTLDGVVPNTPATAPTAEPGDIRVRRVHLTVDSAGFATANPSAHHAWMLAGGRADYVVWIDDVGLVRKIEHPELGSESFLYVGISDDASEFDDVPRVGSVD